MFAIITVIHVLACIFLILVVLLQTGKGAEMGAVFGGSSSTVFGSTGAGNFLTRLTTATAVIFMITSLGLTYFSSRQNTATILDTTPVSAPADGAPAPAPIQNAAPAPDTAPAPEAAAPETAPEAAAPAPLADAAPAPADEPAAAAEQAPAPAAAAPAAAPAPDAAPAP